MLFMNKAIIIEFKNVNITLYYILDNLEYLYHQDIVNKSINYEQENR